MKKTYKHWQPGFPLTDCTDHIEVSGHIGKWYVIDYTITPDGTPVFLLEHETYGCDAAAILVDENAVVLVNECYDGILDAVDEYMDEKYGAGWQEGQYD